MELLVQRKPADGECLPGELFVNGLRYSFTIERTSVAIPAGRWPVQFTESTRVREGSLWSPDPEDRLPLIVVPGRSGIRIHSANAPEQLEGCIAVGLAFVTDRLGNSRAALGPLVADIRSTAARHEAIWIEVRNAMPRAETRNA